MTTPEGLSRNPLETFLRIRWNGMLILSGATLLTAIVGRVGWTTLWPGLILLAAVLGHSVAMRWAVEGPLRQRPTARRILEWLIPALDMIALTALSHLSGGIVSLFSLMPLVYIVAAAPMLGARAAYFCATWGAVLFGAMVLVEARGILQPGQPLVLAQTSWDMIYADRPAVAALFLLEVGFFFLGAYIGSTIAGWLSGQREEITRLYQAAQAEAHKLRQVQEDLVRSGRLAAVGELASGLAHELNNPLGIILGNVQLAQETPHMGTEVQHSLQAIQEAADRIAHLMQVVGELVSLRDKGFETVDIVRVLEDALLLSRKAFEEGGVAVEKQIEQVSPVWGSPAQLYQVLRNLFSNAIEAMQGQEGPRRIAITVHEQPGQVLLSVRDSGPGIPSEHLARVLEPGFTTKVEGGRSRALGLGLFVAYYTVRAHGGELTLSSEEGRGTTVSIVLPAMTEP